MIIFVTPVSALVLQFVKSIIPIPKFRNSKKWKNKKIIKKKIERRCPFVRFYTDRPIIISDNNMWVSAQLIVEIRVFLKVGVFGLILPFVKFF